jgi:hypothetical protein
MQSSDLEPIVTSHATTYIFLSILENLKIKKEEKTLSSSSASMWLRNVSVNTIRTNGIISIPEIECYCLPLYVSVLMGQHQAVYVINTIKLIEYTKL